MGKLINRTPSSHVLISNLPGLALRTLTSILKALPRKLDIKRHSPSILYTVFVSFISLFTKNSMQAKIIPLVPSVILKWVAQGVKSAFYKPVMFHIKLKGMKILKI